MGWGLCIHYNRVKTCVIVGKHVQWGEFVKGWISIIGGSESTLGVDRVR